MEVSMTRTLSWTTSRTAAVIGVLLLFSSSGAFAGTILPVVQPYLSFADSPFSTQTFSYFYLETFEEPNAPTVPGVMYTPGVQVLGPGGAIDSVDGGGNNGHSLFYSCGACGITFTFNAAALGGHLPTSAGIVWTDGDPSSTIGRLFSAYDQNGVLIGQLNNFNDGWFFEGDGNPQHFIFFGATNPGGISSISIANGSGGIEVDHLQFGFQPSSVPEPGSMVLLGTGVLGLAAATRRKLPR
jgi:hypothetical protein